MDKMIYVAMTGAREALRAQSSVSHNLANAATPGFRAVQQSVQDLPIQGPGLASRINAVGRPNAWNPESGAMMQTDRDLDIAVQGQGWIAVQDPAGKEAYTRAGDLRVNATGLLETGTGHLVLGNGGPVSLPPFDNLYIAGDGRISIVPSGQSPDSLVEADQIKLVNPDVEALARSGDGLFRLKDGGNAAADAGVRIANGQLEASNVNPAEALVQMIELSRRFEMQIRSMHTAEQNDEANARLMRMS